MAGYRRYIAALGAMQRSGGRDVSGLPKVATGVMLNAELNQAKSFRVQKIREVGSTIVVWTKVLSAGKATDGGGVTQVTVQACLDSSQTTAVDVNGKNVKKAGTPTHFVETTQMRFTSGVWKAYYVENQKAVGKC